MRLPRMARISASRFLGPAAVMRAYRSALPRVERASSAFAQCMLTELRAIAAHMTGDSAGATKLGGEALLRAVQLRMVGIALPLLADRLYLALHGTATPEQHVWIGRAFFIWVSVFNLFVVSVFWSFVVDVFDGEQGKRLFGFLAAGATLGGIGGSWLTAGPALDTDRPLGTTATGGMDEEALAPAVVLDSKPRSTRNPAMPAMATIAARLSTAAMPAPRSEGRSARRVVVPRTGSRGAPSGSPQPRQKRAATSLRRWHTGQTTYGGTWAWTGAAGSPLRPGSLIAGMVPQAAGRSDEDAVASS